MPQVPAYVALRSGEAAEGLIVKVKRGGVITGRVTDAFGRPFPEARVMLLALRAFGGTRRLVSSGLAVGETDDRGVFRLFEIPEGTYAIEARPRINSGTGAIQPVDEERVRAVLDAVRGNRDPTMRPRTQSVTAIEPDATYLPTYYPGTEDPAQASLVDVHAGQEISAADILLRLSVAQRIRGSVTDISGKPALGARVELLPFDGEVLIHSAQTDLSGAFSFSAIGPGSYRLEATARRVGGPHADTRLFATESVFVGGLDGPAVTMQLRPGGGLAGRVVWAGSDSSKPAFQNVRIGLYPERRHGSSPASGLLEAEPAEGGQFNLTDIPPGRYVLSVRPVREAGHLEIVLKSVLLDGEETADIPITVTPGQTSDGVVLTMSDRTAEVYGRLLDALGEPATNYVVLVFSTNPRHWVFASRRVRALAVSETGEFRVAGIAPGEYFVAAFDGVKPDLIHDDAFLRQAAVAAVRLRLVEGERRAQDFRISRWLP
jgi:protocatechuate 3,4-dioxygenase beta subunit